MFHRQYVDAGPDAKAIVHVHGFGISGTYLEPTAALLAPRYRTFVPDLPGMGRSLRRDRPLDLPGLAGAVISYLDEVGVDRASLVGNSLGCPIIAEVVATHPERVERAVLVSPAGGPNNQPLVRAIRQMAVDGLREPPSMVPIAVRDYLRFGVLQGVSLFRAMMRYPLLERLPDLVVPTLVVAGGARPSCKHRSRPRPLRAPPRPGRQGAGRPRPQLQRPGADRRPRRSSPHGAPLTASSGPLEGVEVLDVGEVGGTEQGGTPDARA